MRQATPPFLPERQLAEMQVGDVIIFGVPERKEMTFFLTRTDEGFTLRGIGHFWMMYGLAKAGGFI